MFCPNVTDPSALFDQVATPSFMKPSPHSWLPWHRHFLVFLLPLWLLLFCVLCQVVYPYLTSEGWWSSRVAPSALFLLPLLFLLKSAYPFPGLSISPLNNPKFIKPAQNSPLSFTQVFEISTLMPHTHFKA